MKKPHIIAIGLRAYIFTYTSKTRTSKAFMPAFCVTNTDKSPSEFVFSTGGYGYERAYEEAVKKYCKLRGVKGKKRTDLMNNIPDRKLFTGFLLKKAHQRGYTDITPAQLRVKLK